ncbi:hypothetical protein M3Y99_00065700 [Aphelenchoides fujianensis]|nr:hypothetical protein M3Y99_00065700 [Aphelenchoides fujianensis]
MPSTSAGERGTITSGKNLLASIIIYGQLKSNDLLKEGDALPASAKLLTRDLIAGIARTQKPECTAELVRDVLHYRSRKARSLFKEFKTGKLRGETPLAERLIEAEKGALELAGARSEHSERFHEPPGDPRQLHRAVRAHAGVRVRSPTSATSLLQTLPPPPPSESRPTAASPPKEEEATIKNDQESHSDGESTPSSSSSYEEQSTEQPPFVSNGFVHQHAKAAPLAPPIDSRTGGRRPNNSPFERQVQMCEEMMATMREMRSFIELQRLNTPLLSAPMPPPANPVPQLSSYLQPSLIPPPLSTNLSSLSSFLAHAADPHQPLL